MKILKSHNDYWTGDIETSILTGCNLLEIDIIYKNNGLWLSHSWRPFEWMLYGKPLKYFSYNYPIKIYIQIEFKTTNRKAFPILAELIRKYSCSNIVFLIDGYNRWYGDRGDIAREFYEKYRAHNVRWYQNFKQYHEIRTIDIFKSKPWYKRLNHW